MAHSKTRGHHSFSTGALNPSPMGPWAPSPWDPYVLDPGGFSKPENGLVRPGDGEVHLWWKKLDGDLATPGQKERQKPGLDEVLAPEERERARRFRRPEDAQSWADGRAWIRTLLGSYLDIRPSEVTFAFGPEGKPYLTGPGEGMHFNLSHSGNRIVLGVSSVVLGVDIEALASDDMALELEGEVCCADELVLLRSMERDRRREMFFSGWVRKESLVKASGKGLSVPLQGIRVLDGDGGGIQPVPFEVVVANVTGGGAGSEIVDFHRESKGFSLWDLRVEAGFVGAVAVAHPNPAFYCWSWVD